MDRTVHAIPTDDLCSDLLRESALDASRWTASDRRVWLATLSDDDLDASERLLDRRPEALLYGVRVGEGAAYRIGGYFARRRTLP